MQAITLEVLTGPELETDADGWEHYAYTVRLTRGEATLESPWRQGTGITDEPTAAVVLEAMLSDAATVENNAGDFESWAQELGYDTDSRKAEATFRACEEQSKKLRELLGDDFDAAVFPDSLDQDDVAARLAAGVELGSYSIHRMYQDERPTETIATGLTRAQAQAHCRRDDTHGPGWFDGFEEE